MIKKNRFLIAGAMTLFVVSSHSYAQEKEPEGESSPTTSETGDTTAGESSLPEEPRQQPNDLDDTAKKQPLQDTPANSNPEMPAPVTHGPEAVLDPVAAPSEIDVSQPSHRYAVGFNLAWTTRQDYGARTFRRLTPEIIGFTYGALPWESVWWRLGGRLGYATAQPEMPQTVRFEETDTTTLLEAAITRDWYVVPTLAFGGGYDFRRIKVKVSAPVDSADDRLNRKETLWMWYVQGGLGLPLLKARILLEPTVRYHTIQYDARSHWLFGIEMTIGI